MRNEAMSIEREIDIEQRARQWDRERSHGRENQAVVREFDWIRDWARSSFARKER